jgi:4-amino-4-deoxy-L-arabinose transferase-like glycosyltransferase
LLGGRLFGRNDYPIDERRALEDYQRLSALFKFYLELVLKAFTFALGIAGGVSAFVLGKNVSDIHIASFGLLFPAVLCIGMGVAFWRAAPSSRELNNALQSLKTSLKRSLAPHASNLTATLYSFGVLLFLCGAFLVVLFYLIYSGKIGPNIALPVSLWFG